MKVSRYMVFLCAATCICLLYTHQQFLLIKANYNIKKYENRFSHLLDRNQELMYNVTALESPASLEAKLDANGISYSMPARWTVAKRAPEGEHEYRLAKVAERRNVVTESILNFLAVKAEARIFEE